MDIVLFFLGGILIGVVYVKAVEIRGAIKAYTSEDLALAYGTTVKESAINRFFILRTLQKRFENTTKTKQEEVFKLLENHTGSYSKNKKFQKRIQTTINSLKKIQAGT